MLFDECGVMTEHDANRLKAVECATGEIEWAWRGELIQWQQKNDDNTRDVLRLNLATRNLRTLPWFHHHPIDLVFESNEYFRRKLGVTPGRQLTLFSFCQDQNRPERRPLERLDRKRHCEIAIEPPFPTLNAAIDSALALERPPEAARRVLVVPPRPVPAPRATRVITGPLNRLELQLRESISTSAERTPPNTASTVAPSALQPPPRPQLPVQHSQTVHTPLTVSPDSTTRDQASSSVHNAYSTLVDMERRLRRADPEARLKALHTPASATADATYPRHLIWQIPAVQALAGVLKAEADGSDENAAWYEEAGEGGARSQSGGLEADQQAASRAEIDTILKQVTEIEKATGRAGS